MFDMKRLAEQELKYQRSMKQVYLGQLRLLPPGRLSVTTVKNKDYYYKYLDGVRSYLGCGGTDEVKALQKRKLLQACIKCIEKNEKILDELYAKFEDLSFERICATLTKAYQPAELNLEQQDGQSEIEWGYQDYPRNKSHPESLVHRTMKGDLVRSKSEVIIANTIYMLGLQYRSEELTKVGNYTFAPDFKIRVPSTGKIKLLEHFGMMHDAAYREKALWKIGRYIENGYRPYEDIIFTFEDLNGNIDAKNLEVLIMNFCR